MYVQLSYTEIGMIIESLECMGEEPEFNLSRQLVKLVKRDMQDDQFFAIWCDEHKII